MQLLYFNDIHGTLHYKLNNTSLGIKLKREKLYIPNCTLQHIERKYT